MTVECDDFDVIYKESLENPEEFWSNAAKAISWDRHWDTLLDNGNQPSARWFVGAKLNTCWNAVDRHVSAGHGERTAIIYDSPLANTKRLLSYEELRSQVVQCAGAIRALGVERGDRVVIYMPMVPEAAVAMLACARIGAVHSVVFGGFAAAELATRIADARPALIITASCGIETQRLVHYKPILDEAVALSPHQPKHCLILQREQSQATMVPQRDVDWHDALKAAKPADCVSVEATDPLYILYTSGTTGQPKGIVRDNGGHAVALTWSLRHFYGINPGDVFWAASDIGWVVGHSYIVYGPLLSGATAVMYEGKPVGTPDAGAYWRLISEYGVKAMFTSPSAIRAIRREDPAGALLKRSQPLPLQALFLAGERSDPDTLEWIEQLLNIPVVDHWWQTESGWPVSGNPLGIVELPTKHGSTSKPVPGWNVQVLDEEGKPCPPCTVGSLVWKLPLPPGALTTLWEAEERFIDSYFRRFPGYYDTADAGMLDQDGYVHVLARTDDVINVAGHRLSTGAMEEVLGSHPAVAESAVVGFADDLKGQVPLGLIVLHHEAEQEGEKVCKEVIGLVRNRIGPVAAFKNVVVLPGLPKTRSGKILRSTLRKIAQGEEWSIPATIEDVALIDRVAVALHQAGYGKTPAAREEAAPTGICQ